MVREVEDYPCRVKIESDTPLTRGALEALGLKGEFTLEPLSGRYYQVGCDDCCDAESLKIQFKLIQSVCREEDV